MNPCLVKNRQAVSLESVPVLSFDDWRKSILESVRGKAGQVWRVCALFAVPRPAEGAKACRLYVVLGNDAESVLSVSCTDVENSYFSLTPDCPQVHLFEREIWEQTGVVPAGHPWLKPLRACGSYSPFFQIQGDEIHEVAVGPVHAGIIEPGHFRFQCHGENVYHLEISLGYQHRGIERVLLGGPDRKTIHLMETVAGDTTVGHTLAYSQAIEGLAEQSVPTRAQALRGIALELERLANHTGDLGALAGDVGFLPTASYCGRLRGDFLNLTAILCGNRFSRGLVRPGGVGFDVDSALVNQLAEKLKNIFKDVTSAVEFLMEAPSVLARFENTGMLTRELCQELGLVGVAARASGVRKDVRQDFPCDIYQEVRIPVADFHSGDVFGRASVRWFEINESVRFIIDQLMFLPSTATRNSALVEDLPSRMQKNALVVSLVEGWRGEICHVAMTNEVGRFAHYKIVDASFHNWTGLAIALRNEQISDFPLCNKSFNLSYCGHDL